MLCAHLLAPRELVLQQVAPPEPRPGEVVVRVEACLTCGTDLKTFRRGHPRWTFPLMLGHEVSGRIHASEALDWPAGTPVMLAPTAPCGTCRPCRRGRGNLCQTLMQRMAHGGFAELYRVPAEVVACNLFHRPDHVSAERAAFLEPLSCVVHGWRRLPPLSEDDTLLILGCGTIGLLFLLLARHFSPARLLVCGRRAERLALAGELGAHGVWGSLQGVPLADVVVECAGTEQSWQEAAMQAAPGGQVLLFGGCPAGSRASFDATRLHYEELLLQGVFHYTPDDVRVAHDLICNSDLPLERLISGGAALSDLLEVMERLDQRDGLKFVVRP